MAHTHSQGFIEAARPSVLHKVPAEMAPVPESWGDGLDSSLFTHPVQLRAQGDGEVLCLRVPALAAGRGALFTRSGPQLTEFAFRRTIASDSDAIGDLNKTKLETHGGRYQMSACERRILKEVASEIGFTGTIHGAGRLIAGTIVCLARPNAYCMILGYDLEFAKFSQGLRVNNQALAELAELGATHVNFLWGDSRWKADLGAERRPLTTFVVCRNRQTFLDPALLRAAFPHAKVQLKRRIKAAIMRAKK